MRSHYSRVHELRPNKEVRDRASSLTCERDIPRNAVGPTYRETSFDYVHRVGTNRVPAYARTANNTSAGINSHGPNMDAARRSPAVEIIFIIADSVRARNYRSLDDVWYRFALTGDY